MSFEHISIRPYRRAIAPFLAMDNSRHNAPSRLHTYQYPTQICLLKSHLQWIVDPYERDWSFERG